MGQSTLSQPLCAEVIDPPYTLTKSPRLLLPLDKAAKLTSSHERERKSLRRSVLRGGWVKVPLAVLLDLNRG
jgi:hypothetical protein